MDPSDDWVFGPMPLIVQVNLLRPPRGRNFPTQAGQLTAPSQWFWLPWTKLCARLQQLASYLSLSLLSAAQIPPRFNPDLFPTPSPGCTVTTQGQCAKLIKILLGGVFRFLSFSLKFFICCGIFVTLFRFEKLNAICKLQLLYKQIMSWTFPVLGHIYLC